MPKYSKKWMCEAYKLPSKIRLAVWRMDENKDTVSLPLGVNIKSAKILYPSRCDGEVKFDGTSLSVTLNSPCTAAVIEVDF
jgi:hypothetical protein